MEVSCPNCSQRLRYSDHLANPLLRCRNCLTTFRPADLIGAEEQPVAAVGVDEYDSDIEGPLPKVATDQLPQSEPDASTSWFGKGGISIGVLLLVIALKAGPRLLRELFRERKPDPPVQMRHEDRQAIDRLLKEAAEKNAPKNAPKNAREPFNDRQQAPAPNQDLPADL
jgi:hypothetical protein